MKKLRNLRAVMAMMRMGAVLTGCGDDDDSGDDDDHTPPGQTIFAPLNEEALTAQNKTYTINLTGQAEPITLTFPAAGQYQVVQGGVTETGAITGASRDGNRWTMTITPGEGAPEGAQTGVLQLDFTANNAGTATFTPTGGTAETGAFTLTEGNGGGDEGGDNGGGVDRTTLTGKTLELTFPGGGVETFQFTSGTEVLYQNTTQGTYTWDQANARVIATLNSGELFTITIPEGSNAATVVYKQDANSPEITDPATYTLQ